MTDRNTYTVRISTKTNIPDDVLVEHVGYALRAVVDPARRKARKSDVKVELVSVERPRSHPFEGGKQVFDDEVTPQTFTFGAGTAQYVVDTEASQVHVINPGAISASPEFYDDLKNHRIPTGSLDSVTQIFSGKAEDAWEDTPLKGTLPLLVPEESDIIEVDISDIIGEVYRAIGEDFPHLAELFQAKRADAAGRDLLRQVGLEIPPAEGDWELPTEDNVGDDID